jgi:hypothetical protein
MELKDVLGLAISGLNMIATTSIAYLVYRFTKKNSTQQALNMLNAEIKDLDQSLTTKFPPDKNITLEDIERANKNDSKTRAEIFEFLNAYEAIAAGVNRRLYDESIVRVARKDALMGTYRRFKSFIEDRRKKYPQAWEQLKFLAEKWERT